MVREDAVARDGTSSMLDRRWVPGEVCCPEVHERRPRSHPLTPKRSTTKTTSLLSLPAQLREAEASAAWQCAARTRRPGGPAKTDGPVACVLAGF